ncbi:DNA damage-induced cell division inhibitor SosA [Staphylococcus sp. IVB6240]|uniref:DNA damage-induced cell division inhibitor SosA n=1 Tax=Staphylococcus sp. IVB6240 TaxID=2989771 RepID=UPI0021D32952|nr:DNA damage-induced cell division inhibitor SosA [Staphylococcus sp. IVB6240]UXR70883.1 hypothetical protein MUA88_06550 [Staphylococcus sp. IVB6240]
MIQRKYSEMVLFLMVFLASVVLFFTFFIMISHNGQTEQTYEMTDHTLKNSEQYESAPHQSNEDSVFAITLSE